MKKVFVVVMDYEENEESMFTDLGVEVTFDNQLFELAESGYVGSYENTVAYELSGDISDNVMKIVNEEA